MTQRLLAFTLSLLAGFLLVSCASPRHSGETAPRPNVVLILADDLGYGDLGCYGQKNFATPHLDRLASDGIRFTQHYAGSTVCAPSRCALMTGRDTGHGFCRGNGAGTLPGTPGQRTVAQVFQSAGYATALVGKTTVNSGDSTDFDAPRRNGFDHFFGVVSHNAAHRQYPVKVWRDGVAETLEGNEGRQGAVYASDAYTRDACAWVARQGREKKPFFLLLSLPMPHADIVVPEDSSAPFVGKFADDRDSTKAGNYTDAPHVKATFAGMVTRIDRYVGDILKQLKESGLDDTTLVIFTSDNGGHLEGGHRVGDFESNGDLRGAKRDLYEGGIRVPFIVRWPDHIKRGQTTGHVSAFWDFLPTVCELTGQAVPENVQGQSFAPTLLGRPGQADHESLYWEFHENSGRRAVRWGNWKAVQYDVKKAVPGPIELYDLERDPGEKTNLAPENPILVAKAIRLFETGRTEPSEAEWSWTRQATAGAKPSE